ncbi:hypothetical protein OG883_30975 [Streptomyces sp. NBC_01142]|uniref:hypothetical protein n=1 Tax=Streptomyces sp. NBC_01142 TaxID=2975865 RepID=UPI00224C9C0F|nr:hypothetical protein [Streptomyces sp. NBC_01142]MCX4824205.1 hypothetical protein [Streptomyces sp. NBC_01142]
MCDPSSFIGALFVGVLGAAEFWLLQKVTRRISRIDTSTATGIIACVAVALLIAVLLIVAVVPYCLMGL